MYDKTIYILLFIYIITLYSPILQASYFCQGSLKKELRNKLPQYLIDLLEREDVVRFVKRHPGVRLLNAKQQQHTKKD